MRIPRLLYDISSIPSFQDNCSLIKGKGQCYTQRRTHFIRDIVTGSSGNSTNGVDNVDYATTAPPHKVWNVAAYVVFILAFLLAMCGVRGVYQQRAARRRRRHEKSYTIPAKADLDTLPVFKLSEDSLADIRLPPVHRRYLINSNAGPRTWEAPTKPKPAHLAPYTPQLDGDMVEYESRCASIDSESSCVICLDEYAIGDLVRVLPCSHIFHDSCITNWLLRPKSTSHECPMCKTPCLTGNVAT